MSVCGAYSRNVDSAENVVLCIPEQGSWLSLGHSFFLRQSCSTPRSSLLFLPPFVQFCRCKWSSWDWVSISGQGWQGKSQELRQIPAVLLMTITFILLPECPHNTRNVTLIKIWSWLVYLGDFIRLGAEGTWHSGVGAGRQLAAPSGSFLSLAFSLHMGGFSRGPAAVLWQEVKSFWESPEVSQGILNFSCLSCCPVLFDVWPFWRDWDLICVPALVSCSLSQNGLRLSAWILPWSASKSASCTSHQDSSPFHANPCSLTWPLTMLLSHLWRTRWSRRPRVASQDI